MHTDAFIAPSRISLIQPTRLASSLAHSGFPFPFAALTVASTRAIPIAAHPFPVLHSP